MPAASITTLEAKEAARLYALGLSLDQVALRVGHSRKAVSNAFRLMGVQIRTSHDGYRTWLKRRGGRGNRAGIRNRSFQQQAGVA